MLSLLLEHLFLDISSVVWSDFTMREVEPSMWWYEKVGKPHSPKPNVNTGQNCQKQTFKGFRNWPNTNAFLKTYWTLNKNNGSLWHTCLRLLPFIQSSRAVALPGWRKTQKPSASVPEVTHLIWSRRQKNSWSCW